MEVINGFRRSCRRWAWRTRPASICTRPSRHRTGGTVRLGWRSRHLDGICHMGVIVVAARSLRDRIYRDADPWCGRRMGNPPLALSGRRRQRRSPPPRPGIQTPSFVLIAALLGGGLAVTTHTTKLGLRYAIDASPEPLRTASPTARSWYSSPRSQPRFGSHPFITLIARSLSLPA